MKIPVLSVLVLLTPDADGLACDGVCRRKLPFRKTWYDEFRFDVIRVWLQPPEFFLNGGVGTLPLALLSNIEFGELPGAINHIKQRVDVELSTAAERTEFWATTEILLGAVYEKPVVAALLKGIANMRESSVVIGYLEEGRREGARHVLLNLGTNLLGEPDDFVRQKIETVSDLDQLDQLAIRVTKATSWNDLFPSEPVR